MIQPHGGNMLVNRIVPDRDADKLLQTALQLKTYRISDADVSVFYSVANGLLSPLEGPMDSAEFYGVLDNEYITRGGAKYAWGIPLAFPIAKAEADRLHIGEPVSVRDSSDHVIGILKISDIYPFDKPRYNKAVYGTDRADHPGPRIMNTDTRDYLLGGTIKALPQDIKPFLKKYLLPPAGARKVFEDRKWRRIVAFQTRNPLHRAHEYAMVYAAEKLTKEGFFTGVVLNPLVGETKSDDVPAQVRVRTYEALIANRLIGYGDKDAGFWKSKGYDLMDQLIMIALDMKMFYAGPKEAVMHAIYRQNLGFTDIIIGRKHADAPFDDGKPAWGDFDAQDKFGALTGDLRIQPVKVGAAAYLEELGRVTVADDYKDRGYHEVSIAGKELRRKLSAGEPIDERVMRAPVAAILAEFYKSKG